MRAIHPAVRMINVFSVMGYIARINTEAFKNVGVGLIVPTMMTMMTIFGMLNLAEVESGSGIQ